MILWILLIPIYVIPLVVNFRWQKYQDEAFDTDSIIFCFMPIVNFIGTCILTSSFIQRGTEYGKLKQQLYKEYRRNDIDNLRNEVLALKQRRIRELEKELL